jgi:hypothetical protein
LVIAAGASSAVADIEVPWKYGQQPDLTTYGVDVSATTAPVADDFPCWEPIPITDIHIWGSWRKDNVCDPANLTFVLRIHSDIPEDESPNGFSIPGAMLKEWVFGPGQYDARLYKQHASDIEDWYDPIESVYLPDDHRQVWQYNFFFPDDPFPQQGTQEQPVIYWLEVQAQVPFDQGEPLYEFGWKTSIQHFMDDAAAWDPGANAWMELRYPEGHAFEGHSMDLAFVMTPEPATVALMGGSVALMLAMRRRRRR